MTTADMIAALLRREGGYVNDPTDAGGETKFGISKHSFPHLDIKNLTESHAAAIYEERYLLKPGIAKLPIDLQPQMLDFAVHSGPYIAIQKLQKALGIDEDGVIGPQTIAFAHAADPRTINNRVVAERIKMIAGIVVKAPGQVKFLRGWVARALEFLL
jgi:lysozyme family protein